VYIHETSGRRNQLIDAELVQRAALGQDQAWETIVRTHGEAVFRLAFLLLSDAADAEDVAQEVFMRAFRSLDRFDRSRPLRPWLMRIAMNLARNRRRSVARYLTAVERWFRLEGRPSFSSHSAGSSGVSDDERHDLRRAVDRLVETDREVVYLRYFVELGEAEAAAALGVPVGTVKSRLSRALARLREIVNAEFPGLRGALEP
jgi:RNA polymerase sigma factor (sigma-70 family)